MSSRTRGTGAKQIEDLIEATNILIAQSNVLLNQIGGILNPIDVSDRAARLLGIVTAANLDVALSTRASEATVVKLVPIVKATIFNTALPIAEASLLAVAIAPTNSPSYLRIYVCFSVGGILRVARIVGGVTVVENLNDGVALIADSAYMFTVEWRTGDAINFRYSVTGGNTLVLRADEIGAAE